METAGVVFNECGPNTASCPHNIPIVARGEHTGVNWRARCLALPNPSAVASVFNDNDPSTHIVLDSNRDLEGGMRPKAGSLLIDACAGGHWVRPNGGLQDIPRLLIDFESNPRPISYGASSDTPLDIGAFEFVEGGAPGVAMAVADLAAEFDVTGSLNAGQPVDFHLGGSIVRDWTPERTPALYRKTVDMSLPTVFDRPVEVLSNAGYACVTAPTGTRLVNCNAPNSNIAVDDEPAVRARVRTGASLPAHVNLVYELSSPRVFDPVPDNNVATFRLDRDGDKIFADRFQGGE